jgi:hypothetical protein
MSDLESAFQRWARKMEPPSFRKRLRERWKRFRKAHPVSRFARFFDLAKWFVKGWPGTWREIRTAWLVSDPAYQGSRYEKFLGIVKRVGCDDPKGNVEWAWELSHPLFLVAWRWCRAMKGSADGLGVYAPVRLEVGPNMRELFLHTATRRESVERIADLIGMKR